jgi:hypothetical protein
MNRGRFVISITGRYQALRGRVRSGLQHPNMKPEIKSTLTNCDAIAVDRDLLGKQRRQAARCSGAELNQGCQGQGN